MGKYKFEAGKEIGKYHIEENLVLQDDAEAIKTSSGEIVIVISDGMGSYRYSQYGAKALVEYVIHNSRNIMDLLINRQSILVLAEDIIAKVRAYAKSNHIPFNEMHSTLSFAIVGEEQTLLFSIGDSPLYIKYLDDEQNSHVEILNGNRGNERNQYITYSALSSISYIYADIKVIDSKCIQDILITSDGALGYEKISIDEMTEFPSWYYDMTSDKISIKDTIHNLVTIGYDDTSIAYYHNCNNK